MAERVLTVKQPWADLIMAGGKNVENRSWPVPSTLPQWIERTLSDGSLDRVYAVNDLGDKTYAATGWRRVGPFPLRLWIHGAATFADGWKAEVLGDEPLWLVHLDLDLTAPWVTKDRLGALLGSVTVTGCHPSWECVEPDRVPFYPEDPNWRLEATCSPEWGDPDHGVFHWTLADPQPLAEPIPMRGRQRLWTLPADVGVPA